MESKDNFTNNEAGKNDLLRLAKGILSLPGELMESLAVRGISKKVIYLVFLALTSCGQPGGGKYFPPFPNKGDSATLGDVSPNDDMIANGDADSENPNSSAIICPTQPPIIEEFRNLSTTLDQCKGCHNPIGIGYNEAKNYGWEWDGSADPKKLRISFKSLFKRARQVEADGSSHLVSYPQMKSSKADGTQHGGGKQSLDTAQIAQLSEFAKNALAIPEGEIPDVNTNCDFSAYTEDSLFENVDLLSPAEVYIKFKRNVTGSDLPSSLPNIQTKDQLRNMLMQETQNLGFYDWLKTEFNDITLTRAFTKDNKALEIMGNAYGIDWKKFDNAEVADSPQNLFAWLVANNRSVKELGTASYIVTPGYKPTAGQPDNWLSRLSPQVIDDIPVSGILSQPIWLSRFPSTETNVNRNRSRLVLNDFYDLDVLSLGTRNIPAPAEGVVYPTLTYAPCLPCHAGSPLDLGARAFRKFDYTTGKFQPNATEPAPISLINMGLYGKQIPHNSMDALRQFMYLLTLDPELSSSDPGYDENRKYPFAKAMSKMAYKFLMHRDPSAAPKEEEMDYDAKMNRYTVENKFLNKMAEFLHENNYNYRKLVVEMALSKWYAASGSMTTEEDLSPSRTIELANIGPVLATPEVMAKRLRQFLGPDAEKMGLTKKITNDYALDLLGIDSVAVTTRQRDPNSSYELRLDSIAIDNVGKIVVADLAKAPADRQLFPYLNDWANLKLEAPIHPGTKEAVPQIEMKYRQTITRILTQAFGKYYAVNSPEVDEAYDKWLEIWQMFLVDNGNGKVADTHQVAGVDAADPYGIIRTWEAFIAWIVQSEEFNLSQREMTPGEDDYFWEAGRFDKVIAAVNQRSGRLEVVGGIKENEKKEEPEGVGIVKNVSGSDYFEETARFGRYLEIQKHLKQGIERLGVLKKAA